MLKSCLSTVFDILVIFNELGINRAGTKRFVNRFHILLYRVVNHFPAGAHGMVITLTARCAFFIRVFLIVAA